MSGVRVRPSAGVASRFIVDDGNADDLRGQDRTAAQQDECRGARPDPAATPKSLRDGNGSLSLGTTLGHRRIHQRRGRTRMDTPVIVVGAAGEGPGGEEIKMGRLRRILAVFAATGALAVGLLVAAAGPAAADYGPGALYQVEISANNVGSVPGDGVWLWIALYPDHTGDYTGSDCIHTGSLLGHPGLNGAGNQRGDVTWTDSGGTLTITGVALVDGMFPVTITVPDGYGHYTLASDAVITGFALGSIGGTAQVQIAP